MDVEGVQTLGGKGCPASTAPTSPMPAKKRILEKAHEQEEEEEPKKPRSAPKKVKQERVETQSEKESIAEKKELDKMYQAMKYLDKKGNGHPLAMYNKLVSRKDKQDFYNKYLKDKKFEWVAIDEVTSVSNSTDSQSFQGWMSKYQVAHHEKLPAESPLLVAKLASLPSRAHPIQEWRDKGEMEYYYTSNQIQATSDKVDHGMKVTGHGHANPKNADVLLHGLPGPSQGPPKAIEDGTTGEKEEGPQEKGEAGEDEEHKAIMEAWGDLKGKLQKTCRQMGDLCMEAQTIQGALGGRAHLAGLVAEVKKHTELLEPSKQEALAALGLMNTITNQAEIKVKIPEMQKLQETCSLHIEGFKKGAFKEARTLLKNI
jgi:hypothetical protein